MKNFFDTLDRMNKERYLITIDKIIREKVQVAFLSDNAVDVATETVKNFRKQNLNITILIVENLPENFNKTALDFSIISLNDVPKLQPTPQYIFVEDLICSEVAAKKVPIAKVIMLQNKNLGTFRAEMEKKFETYIGKLTKFEILYKSLSDENSRKTFCAYFFSNVLSQVNEVYFSTLPHYLTEGFIPNVGDIVINFEKTDYNDWRQFLKLNCAVYNLGTTNKDSKTNDGYHFEISNNSLSLAGNLIDDEREPDSYNHDKFIMLDDYMRDKKIPKIDFINLNLQENELNVLRGAAEIILRFKPTIAITTHGKWEELSELVEFIKSIRSDYEFAMRQCITTPKEEPEKFQIGVEGGLEKKLLALGLEVDIRNMDEVTLLAH